MADPQFEGVYGPYSITETDRREVHRYRLALLTTGLALLAGVLHCWLLGAHWAWLWILPVGSSLGLALLWIHIYLRPLHRALQLFWLMGCIGWATLLISVGPTHALITLADQRLWILAIGPCSPPWRASASRSSSASSARRRSASPCCCLWLCWGN